MDTMIELVVVGVCLVLSAFFSGSETALLRLASHEVEEDARAMRGASQSCTSPGCGIVT